MKQKRTEIQEEANAAHDRTKRYVAEATGAFEHRGTPRKPRKAELADTPPAATDARALIAAECDALKALLLEKNAGYGNSALDPVRTFSSASPIEQILVRIDDKLSRIQRGDLTKVSDEPLRQTVRDLQGYLVLLQVAWRLGLK